MVVRALLDTIGYKDKTSAKRDAGKITRRIAEKEVSISIEELAKAVGENGQTFCPAVFNGGRRQKNFREMQIFSLDFDDGASYDDIKQKFIDYGIPICFSYYTLSSTEAHPKFRIILCHVVPITDYDVAHLMLDMFKILFPEADRSCFEPARMFFGGKRIIEVDADAIFSFDHLNDIFHIALRLKDKRNYMQNLRGIARRNHIGINGSALDIRIHKGDTDFKDFVGNNIKYLIQIPGKSLKILIFKPDEQQTPLVSLRCMQTAKRLEKVNEDRVKSICMLYKDFAEGKNLSHDAKFLIATNVQFFKGYIKRFLDYIKLTAQNESDIYRWKYELQKIYSEYKYNPKNCNSHDCPYYEHCYPDFNIYLTVKGRHRITYIGEDEYVPLELAYKKTEEAIKEAIVSQDKCIHLVRAQTGIGKTTIYSSIVRDRDERKRYIIALPTVKLKNEVAKLIGDKGYEVVSLKELLLPEDIQMEVERLYAKGSYKEGKDIIRKFSESLEDDLEVKKRCLVYLSYREVLKEHDKSLIMTHAQFLNLSTDDVSGYTIIIDEDILLSILKNIKTISLADIHTAIGHGIITGRKAEELESVLQMETGKYRKSGFQDRYSYVTEEQVNEAEIDGDINDLLRAGSYYMDKDKLWYFVPRTLPEQKIIIMSATLDSEVYSRYFPDRSIKIHDIPQARYKGRVIQYSFYPLSRKNLRDLDKAGWDIEQLYGKVMEITERDISYGISFKENDSFLSSKLEMPSRHFGNSAGTDIYKGKNGVVIGTPHLNEESYKLIGCYLGVDMDRPDCQIKRRKVRYNDFEFYLMSYGNPLLRQIQLYMISSELEQSIGRTRLLRNDAKVFVFSNFPCQQAILHQEDYLKKINDKLVQVA